MNEKAKNLFRNLNYTVTANLLVLVISVILNLIVPKYLGIKDYGYWQLYVFYSSYIGFFHFGWIDGIYLKIGGEEYDELDKRSLGTQFHYLLIFELILAFLLSMFAFFMVDGGNRKIIWFSIAIMLVVANLKTFVLFILQSTNRIKDYAKVSRDDRYIYLVGTLVYLYIGGRNPLVLILLDVLARLVVTIFGIIKIKDIVFEKRNSFSNTMSEIKINILSGSNLMIGYIASILIIGIPRFIVERQWNIEEFGKLSFALSISNMFLVFINSVSVVLYPLLRRTNQENLPRLYIQVRNVFVPFTFLLLLFFNPVRTLLEWWLPEYSNSLFYMSILFPMIVYEGRISLLINTYLKTIREEKIILNTNIVTLVVSSILSLIAIYIFNSMTLVVLGIIFSLAFRCILTEIVLAKVMNINMNIKNISEVFLVLLFIVGNLFFQSWGSFTIYLVGFSVYILCSIKDIKYGLKYFNQLLINR